LGQSGPLDLETMSARIQDTKNGDPRTAYLTDELVAELRALEPRRIHYGRGPLRVFCSTDRRNLTAGGAFMTNAPPQRHGM
jgi:hypothetical protein